MNFFELALEELNDDISETIRYNAIAHRFSKMEQKDFDKFIKLDDKGKKTPKDIIVDHQAQMNKSKRD